MSLPPDPAARGHEIVWAGVVTDADRLAAVGGERDMVADQANVGVDLPDDASAEDIIANLIGIGEPVADFVDPDAPLPLYVQRSVMRKMVETITGPHPERLSAVLYLGSTADPERRTFMMPVGNEDVRTALAVCKRMGVLDGVDWVVFASYGTFAVGRTPDAVVEADGMLVMMVTLATPHTLDALNVVAAIDDANETVKVGDWHRTDNIEGATKLALAAAIYHGQTTTLRDRPPTADLTKYPDGPPTNPAEVLGPHIKMPPPPPPSAS